MVSNVKRRLRSKSPIRDAREDLMAKVNQSGIMDRHYGLPREVRGGMIAGAQTPDSNYVMGLAFSKTPRDRDASEQPREPLVRECRRPLYRNQ